MKNNNMTIETEHDCPKLEQLSGFYDNALELPDSVIKHINNCPQCTAHLKQFRMFDMAIEKQLSAAIPKNLIENIKTKVHEELATPLKSSQPVYKLFLKLAAAFAIISFVAFYGTDLFTSGEVKHPHPVQRIYPVQTIQPANQNSNVITPYYNNRQPNFLSGTLTENSIPLNNIIGVNYGGTREPVFQIENQADNKNTLSTIAPTVHQVWISSNPAQAVARFKGIIKNLNIAPTTKVKELNGEFSGTIDLTKMQLVKLVRACKQSGLDLLSPQSPQPEQNKFRGKPNSQVKYSFDILSSEN